MSKFPPPPITDKRISLMKEGSHVLIQWLEWVIDNGLEVLEKDPQTVQGISKQMVDFKMGGIAHRLQNLNDRIASKEPWMNLCHQQLARMHRAALGILSWEDLELLWKWDVAQYTGITIKKDLILKRSPIHDHWVVIGREEDRSQSLVTYKTWLFGLHHGFALITDFVFGRQRPRLLPLGNHYLGDFHYYPSGFQLRGLTSSLQMTKKPFLFNHGWKNWDRVKLEVERILSFQPWIEEVPLHLTPLRLESKNDKYFAIDEIGNGLEIRGQQQKHLADLTMLHADSRIDLWGLWGGQHFDVIGVYGYDQLLNAIIE